MRTILIGAVAIAALGCSANIGDPEKAPRAQWMLRADPELALVDPRCSGESCPRYPNPGECRSMAIEVLTNGSVCGVCDDGETRTRSCGGPIRGIPYRCGVSVGSAGACLECTDVFGTSVLRDCGGNATVGYALATSRDEGAPDDGSGGWSVAEGDGSGGSGGDIGEPPAGGTCYDARRGDGSACRICVDAESRITHDDCTGDGGGSTGGGTPGGGGSTPPAGGAVCGPDSFITGQRAFTDALNEILREAGIDLDYTPRAPAGATPGEGADFFATDSLCNELDEEVADLIERRGPEWFREGRPRCGFMVSTAASRVCPMTQGCAPTAEGVVAEMTFASMALDDSQDCIGSPIVLDLDGNGIRTVQGSVRFDVASTGSAQSTAWIAPGDALLARDRDGDGVIADGRELFGDGTVLGAGMAPDGFAALAALDADHDGDVDARDPEWATLRLWRDDGDGVTEPGELLTLAEAEIRRLSVESTSVGALDQAGSILALWSRFERTDGSRGIACDVFFASGRREEAK